jgi:uncharacterized protein YdaU (DUF1376 family)
MRMKLLAAIGLALATQPSQVAVAADDFFPQLGYAPPHNKRIAQRLKRKADRRRAEAKAGAKKPHNQRNKKGRP